MITLTDFWAGRDVKYASECSLEIKTNAAETVKRVNKLLALAEKNGLTCSKVSSGWRPKLVNDATANAGKLSNHITGRAADLFDPSRLLAQWVINNKDNLALCGLWIEDPRWTPTWLHLQSLPPPSGKLVYIPTIKPPRAPKLIGQTDLPLTRIV